MKWLFYWKLNLASSTHQKGLIEGGFVYKGTTFYACSVFFDQAVLWLCCRPGYLSPYLLLRSFPITQHPADVKHFPADIFWFKTYTQLFHSSHSNRWKICVHMQRIKHKQILCCHYSGAIEISDSCSSGWPRLLCQPWRPRSRQTTRSFRCSRTSERLHHTSSWLIIPKFVVFLLNHVDYFDVFLMLLFRCEDTRVQLNTEITAREEAEAEVKWQWHKSDRFAKFHIWCQVNNCSRKVKMLEEKIEKNDERWALTGQIYYKHQKVWLEILFATKSQGTQIDWLLKVNIFLPK